MPERLDLQKPPGRYQQRRSPRPHVRGYTDSPKLAWGTPAVTATHASAGTPGYFLPAGATRPANLAGMSGIVALPATAWTTGQRVAHQAGNCYWNGTVWTAGSAP